MRSARTSIVLGLLALGLGAYVLLVDRGSLSSGELDQRKGSVLPELVRARISRLEIQRKGKLTLLTRDPEGEDEASLWQVREPYVAKADAEAVESLFGALDWIDARRRLQHISDADRKRFGLTTPRYRVSFTVGKVRVPLLLGNETPRGDGLYAQTSDPTTAYVVGKDVLEALDHEPEHYHTKELHDGVLLGTTQRISFCDAEGERVVRKHDDRLWHLDAPPLGLASGQVVADVVAAIDALRAARFVAAQVKDLSAYGLGPPSLDVTLVKTRLIPPKPEDSVQGKPPPVKREPVELRLRFGAACNGHPDERYVTVDDAATVYCVLEADVAKLRKPVEALRESRLLPLDDDDVETVQIDRGDARLVVRKEDGGSSYEATRKSAAPLKGPARAGAVEDWLKALRAAKVERFDAEPVSGSDRANVITLHFDRGKDRPPYDVRIDASRSDELRAQRADETTSLVLSGAALELVTPTAARFRKLDLLTIAESGLRGIEVRRGPEVERLSRSNAQASFELTSPLTAPTDALASQELTRLLCTLQAERYVADAPEPEHGLTNPAAVVAVRYVDADAAQTPKQFTLRVGAETPGGRFAVLDGQPGVFVLGARLVSAIFSPVVSRTLLATPIEQIRAIELDHGGHKLRIERSAGGFTGVSGAAISAGQARAVAERLATLRASKAVGYGSAAEAAPQHPPFARISVETDVPNATPPTGRLVISIGAETEGGARHVRRDDRAVDYLLAKDTVDALLAPLALAGDQPR